MKKEKKIKKGRQKLKNKKIKVEEEGLMFKRTLPPPSSVKKTFFRLIDIQRNMFCFYPPLLNPKNKKIL